MVVEGAWGVGTFNKKVDAAHAAHAAHAADAAPRITTHGTKELLSYNKYVIPKRKGKKEHVKREEVR